MAKYRTMRRKHQEISEESCRRVLREATSGVLALCGADAQPYAVPMSYVYDEGRIYFHSAIEGHKIDVIRDNPRASFCVVDCDKVVAEEFTTYFRSVIAFGVVKIITDTNEKMTALRKLATKYSPGRDEAMDNEIAKGFDHLLMLELSIEHMTGKEAIELVRMRPGNLTDKER